MRTLERAPEGKPCNRAGNDEVLPPLPANAGKWKEDQIERLRDYACFQEGGRLCDRYLHESLANFDRFPILIRGGYYEHEIRKTEDGRLEARTVKTYKSAATWVKVAGGKRLIRKRAKPS